MIDVTNLLAEIAKGDRRASEQLLPLVYNELRRLAAYKMAKERPGQTLQPTALVHEAYLRLVEDPRVGQWNSRAHFFAAAGEAMRRILVESARRKKRLKHGAGHKQQSVDAVSAIDFQAPVDELIAVDEALERLERQDPDAATLVKLRFFGGLPMAQVAEALGKPLRTVEREWTYARSWLHRELS
jgi:RNA polymerase sigma factor (TIGR02999 family)